MRTLTWDRASLIDRARGDIWRYLTPASNIETELLQAAALLQMRPYELRTIGALEYLTSNELGNALEAMPTLLRRLANTSTAEEEWSYERVRGAIQWQRTLGVRYATGNPHVFVTAPTRRAFQTPENEILVHVLDRTVELGRSTGWHRSTSETVGRLVTRRIDDADRWRKSRMLTGLDRRPITPRTLHRATTGRARRRYQPILDCYQLLAKLTGRLDRHAIRKAVETRGLTTRDDPTLFELVCTFDILAALGRLGWELQRFALIAGSLQLTGTRGDEHLRVTYQRTPRDLARGSRYGRVQKDHEITPGGLRPDLVLLHIRQDRARWLLVEVKGGASPVAGLARRALYDLLAYRTAFASALHETAPPYGLGVVWGAELQPVHSGEVMLSTPDRLEQSLREWLRST